MALADVTVGAYNVRTGLANDCPLWGGDMTRMNWDRVHSQDRSRGGLSNMELEDEREEAWFESEKEREAERDARRREREVSIPRGPGTAGKPLVSPGRAPVAAAPTPRPPKGDTNPIARSTTASPPAAQTIADHLGVTVAELKTARQRIANAASGLAGMSKTERARLTASRLGISPGEVKILRDALHAIVQNPRSAAVLVRTVLMNPEAVAGATRASLASGRGSTGGVSQAPPKRKATRPSGVGSSTGSVYVTKWGNVVHLYWDCSNARGFRHTGEPDADVYKVHVADPCCRGRRVCATCSRGSGSAGAAMEKALRSRHGKAFDEGDWERHGWTRPMPQGKPINRS